LGDRVGIGAVWLNIASAYAEMALWRDCLHANARVVDLAKAMPETHHRRGYLLDRAWHGLAIAQYNLQQHSAAAEACECAIAAIVDTADPMEALVLTAAEATFTFVLLRLERLQEAKVHAAACVSAALTAGTGRADLVARLASGLVDVYVGEVEAGITRLEAALSDAIAIGPSQYDEALRVLVLAHEKAGRPERALHYQRELIRHSLEAQAAHIRDTLITQQAVADGQATRVDPYAPQALASLQARLAALLDRPHRSVGARLRRLNDLWEEKMITREESAEQRARILAQL
jgi:tetratricopeptide (TPR) repeat protein